MDGQHSIYKSDHLVSFTSIKHELRFYTLYTQLFHYLHMNKGVVKHIKGHTLK